MLLPGLFTAWLDTNWGLSSDNPSEKGRRADGMSAGTASGTGITLTGSGQLDGATTGIMPVYLIWLVMFGRQLLGPVSVVVSCR